MVAKEEFVLAKKAGLDSILAVTLIFVPKNEEKSDKILIHERTC